LAAVKVVVATFPDPTVTEEGEMVGPLAGEELNVTASPEKLSPEGSVGTPVSAGCPA
jgi:hypothetical protein